MEKVSGHFDHLLKFGIYLAQKKKRMNILNLKVVKVTVMYFFLNHFTERQFIYHKIHLCHVFFKTSRELNLVMFKKEKDLMPIF